MAADLEAHISNLLCDAIKVRDLKKQALCETALKIGSGWNASKRQRRRAADELLKGR